MVAKVVVLAANVTAPPTDTTATLAHGQPRGSPVTILFVVGVGAGILALRRFRRTT
jgi:hypothetical protein